MEFSYRLGEAGWATVSLQQGECHYQLMVSYLSNALEDLTNATNAMLAGSDHETVVLMAEPGEHHLLLNRLDDDLLVEVRWFDSWASKGMHPSNAYEVRFMASVPEIQFSAQVHQSLATILTLYGVEGYRDKWIDHEFPSAAFHQLTKNIEVQVVS